MINIPLHQQRWESDCSTRWSNLIELSPILFSWRLNFSEIASRKINLKTTLEVEKTEVKPGSCRESRKLGSEQCSGRFHSEDLGGPKPGGKKLLQCNTFDAWNHPKGRRESLTVTAEQARRHDQQALAHPLVWVWIYDVPQGLIRWRQVPRVVLFGVSWVLMQWGLREILRSLQNALKGDEKSLAFFSSTSS